jgi:hypothetical protein
MYHHVQKPADVGFESVLRLGFVFDGRGHGHPCVERNGDDMVFVTPIVKMGAVDAFTRSFGFAVRLRSMWTWMQVAKQADIETYRRRLGAIFD